MSSCEANPKQTAEVDGLAVPSGPAPLPIVGNLYDLTGPTKRHIPGHPDGGMHEHLPRLVGEYGGIFTIQIPSGLVNQPFSYFNPTQVVLADPELLGEMFQRTDVFQKRLFKHSKIRQGPGGQGLFSTDDDEPIHDQAARVLLPAFSMKGMQEYFEIILETTAVLQQQFEAESAGGTVDLHPLLSRYTFDIIGKVGFGVDFKSLTGPCKFLETFADFSATNVKLGKGIGGYGATFASTKVSPLAPSTRASPLSRSVAHTTAPLAPSARATPHPPAPRLRSSLA